MSFRVKLLLIFTLIIAASVGLVAWGVSLSTQKAFEEFDEQRTNAIVAQFRREFQQRGTEISARVRAIADNEATLRMAIDLSRPEADASVYVNDAHSLADSSQLDFLDLATNDGTLVSSAEYPARFGYKYDWLATREDWNTQSAFLGRVDLADNNVDLGFLSVRVVSVGDKKLYVIGGERLDKAFLSTLELPAGMRVLLYSNFEPGFSPDALADASGPVIGADRFESLIEKEQQQPATTQQRINWSTDPTSGEEFTAIPLQGRAGDLLGVFLVGSSRRELVAQLAFIRSLAIVVGGAGILLGMILSWWIAARVTRPIVRLARAADAVAAGNWEARVRVRSRDEVGRLGTAFNKMTRQLAEQQERLVQSERVAAWRELARRLAHELKNPLFPLQITVENLQRAREQGGEQFDEVFFESTAALKAELESLKAIVTRFSDFAKMPTPEFERVDLNEVVRSAVRVFEPQFSALGRPPIAAEFSLDDRLPLVEADPVLLHRALENLVLNAMDAMPSGGTITLRSSQKDGHAHLEVSDTGEGLAKEECERLFTPYYTTKRHGTGLGLAIVQSVVSDHAGTVTVASVPGHGTTFRIELPIEQPRPMQSAHTPAREEAAS
jgi:two-component system, NtrC family, nitrogen regulation sensor histidine kinase NtrY